MIVKNSKQRHLFLAVLLAVVLLFFPQLFFEPLSWFTRGVTQVLLVVGLFGSIRESKSLRVVGWIGFFFFFWHVVFGSLPSVDHPDFDANGKQQFEHWGWRPALALAFFVTLVVLYRKSGPKKPLVAER